MIVEESARLSCPTATNMPDAALMTLIRAMVATDRAVALSLLEANPALARAHFELGATRRTAKTYHMYEIGHYIYAGDTALHVAAAAHQQEIVQKLIAAGANVRARNRRGAEPLHYAADRAHIHGTHPRKRRPSPVLSKQAPIQTLPIKAE